jgi:hypothetical protein
MNLARVIAKILFTSLIILLLGFILVLIMIRMTDYQALVNFVLKQLHRPELVSIIRQQYFTIEKFSLLQNIAAYIIPILVIGIILLLFKSKRIISSLSAFSKIVIDEKRNHAELLRNAPMSHSILLIGLSVFAVFRFAWMNHQYPIQYDEAWNYNYFLHGSFFNSLVAYNNYPLHNLITYPIVQLLGEDVWVLRLPSLLFAIATMYALYIVVQQLFSYKALSVLSSLIFITLPAVVYYSFYARGVMIHLFFAVWICFYTIRLIEEKFSLSKMMFVALLHSFALWSMLSHVYFMGVIFLFAIVVSIMQSSFRYLTQSMFILVLSALISTIIFLPMILGSGIRLGTHAALHAGNQTTLHYAPFENYSLFIVGNRFLLYGLLVSSFIFSCTVF